MHTKGTSKSRLFHEFWYLELVLLLATIDAASDEKQRSMKNIGFSAGLFAGAARSRRQSSDSSIFVRGFTMQQYSGNK